MDTDKAKAFLAQQLEKYRAKPYAALKELVGKVDAWDAESPDGLIWQIEIQVFWDDKPDGDIRVIGAIDDRGRRAYAPLTDDFIMTPDGAFLGE